MKTCLNCRYPYEIGMEPFQIDEWLCRECQRNPATQVRVLLARARLQALEFDRAWQYALGCTPGDEPVGTDGLVRWPHDTDHRREWKSVFADRLVVGAWGSAYRLETAGREATLSMLVVAA